MTSIVRWLPDFAANQRLLLAWPYRSDVWRNGAEPARTALLNLIKQLPGDTAVSLVVASHLSGHLPSSLKSTHCIEIDYDDIWLRDIGPLWCNTESGLKALSFNFDGWGGVQQTVGADRYFSGNLCSYLNHPIQKSELIAEGGAFTHNGKGDWLIGLGCIKKRNPGLTDEQLKSELGRLLPEQRLHFFDGALVADETGGHIDNMALFVGASTVLYAFTDNKAHPDYSTCQSLKKCVSQLPEYIQAIPLPLPLPQFATEKERQTVELTDLSLQRTVNLPLLCSYVNVLQTNHLVVLPRFGLATDNEAFQVVSEALPDKKVITCDAREFVLGGGGLHCVSHNLPIAKR